MENKSIKLIALTKHGKVTSGLLTQLRQGLNELPRPDIEWVIAERNGVFYLVDIEIQYNTLISLNCKEFNDSLENPSYKERKKFYKWHAEALNKDGELIQGNEVVFNYVGSNIKSCIIDYEEVDYKTLNYINKGKCSIVINANSNELK